MFEPFLTQLQSVPRELPLVGVVRQPFTLLIHGHVLRVEDHGKISRLQVFTSILKQYQTDSEYVVNLFINLNKICLHLDVVML